MDETFVLRPVRPEDKGLFREGFSRMSEESRYLRFFSPKLALTDADLRYLTEVDGQDHYAVIAVATDREGREHGAGVARFVRLAARPDTAEAAFTVVDPYQGRGLGVRLFRQLIEAARERGVRTFLCEVLPGNERMKRLIREVAPGTKCRADGSALCYEVSLFA